MLNEQLQKQIEQEAEHYANVQIGDKAKFIGHHDSRRWDDAKEDWEAGAEHYATLWQAAEEKAARYEKALKEVQGIVCAEIPNGQDVGKVSAGRCIEIDSYITDFLTPKTGEDEKA